MEHIKMINSIIIKYYYQKYNLIKMLNNLLNSSNQCSTTSEVKMKEQGTNQMK